MSYTKNPLLMPIDILLLASSGVILTPKRSVGQDHEHDHRENELSLIHGFRLLSAYTLTSGTKIWIITEADRRVTTVLMPEEY
jgi:hypothetical protein